MLGGRSLGRPAHLGCRGEPGSPALQGMCPEGWQGLEAVEGSQREAEKPPTIYLGEISRCGCPSPAPDSQRVQSWC